MNAAGNLFAFADFCKGVARSAARADPSTAAQCAGAAKAGLSASVLRDPTFTSRSLCFRWLAFADSTDQLLSGAGFGSSSVAASTYVVFAGSKARRSHSADSRSSFQ